MEKAIMEKYNTGTPMTFDEILQFAQQAPTYLGMHCARLGFPYTVANQLLAQEKKDEGASYPGMRAAIMFMQWSRNMVDDTGNPIKGKKRLNTNTPSWYDPKDPLKLPEDIKITPPGYTELQRAMGIGTAEPATTTTVTPSADDNGKRAAPRKRASPKPPATDAPPPPPPPPHATTSSPVSRALGETTLADVVGRVGTLGKILDENSKSLADIHGLTDDTFHVVEQLKKDLEALCGEVQLLAKAVAAIKEVVAPDA